MARRSIVQRIAQLEARKQTLLTRLGRHTRARDTRRKILLGAFVLHQLQHGKDPVFDAQLRQWLRDQLPGFLVRENDRELFEEDLLLPLQEEQLKDEEGSR
ncbi:mobilization protein [Rhizobium sp. ZW T2_16]|uniref:mobilization protein n=1 Tax=Rhizobium sp. ZW T2_16 TaxID=3378083 RepID=UPI003854F4C0